MFFAALLATSAAAMTVPVTEEPILSYTWEMPGGPAIQTILRCQDMEEANARMPDHVQIAQETLEIAFESYQEGAITKAYLDEVIENYVRTRTMQSEIRTFSMYVCNRQ